MTPKNLLITGTATMLADSLSDHVGEHCPLQALRDESTPCRCRIGRREMTVSSRPFCAALAGVEAWNCANDAAIKRTRIRQVKSAREGCYWSNVDGGCAPSFKVQFEKQR